MYHRYQIKKYDIWKNTHCMIYINPAALPRFQGTGSNDQASSKKSNQLEIPRIVHRGFFASSHIYTNHQQWTSHETFSKNQPVVWPTLQPILPITLRHGTAQGGRGSLLPWGMDGRANTLTDWQAVASLSLPFSSVFLCLILSLSLPLSLSNSLTRYLLPTYLSIFLPS